MAPVFNNDYKKRILFTNCLWSTEMEVIKN